MSVHEHVFEGRNGYVIKCKHVHAGVWLSPTIKVGSVKWDGDECIVELVHVSGVSMGEVSSKGGEALLSVDAEA